MELMQEIIKMVALCMAVIGGIISVRTYRSAQLVKRAEWLKSLFDLFFIQDTFKEVRRWLDFDILGEKLANDPDHLIEEKFTDYLNFFEFIATLKIQKQLSLEEINHLFYYYLDLIKKSEICRKYIQAYGFKHLENLLANIR